MDHTSQYRARGNAVALIVGGAMLLLSLGCCRPEQTVAPDDADELLLAVAYAHPREAKEALVEIMKTRSKLKYVYAFLAAYRRDDLNRARVVTRFGEWLKASQHTPDLLLEGGRHVSAHAWALREEVRSTDLLGFAPGEFDLRRGRTSAQVVVPNGVPHLSGMIATGGGMMKDCGTLIRLDEQLKDTSVRELVDAVEKYSGRKIEWSGPLPEGFLDWGITTSNRSYGSLDPWPMLEHALRKLAELRLRYPIWKHEQEHDSLADAQVWEGSLPTCICIPLPGKFVFVYIPAQPGQPHSGRVPQTDEE